VVFVVEGIKVTLWGLSFLWPSYRDVHGGPARDREDYCGLFSDLAIFAWF
jgi:hypothetical protein